MNRTVKVLSLLLIFVISCKDSKHNNLAEDKPSNDIEKTELPSKKTESLTPSIQTQVNSTAASGFVKSLENGDKLGTYFNDNWTFIYHSDNRCDGSTDGYIDNLKSVQIDTIISLKVKNDGDGWACDKKEPKSFDLDFNLKAHITHWDRFEIPVNTNQEKNNVYIEGAGESDYLKLLYNDKNLIIKLEYRSEDPG